MQVRKQDDEARQEAELEALRQMLTPTKEILTKLYSAFLVELQRGLEMHKKHGVEWVESECSMKMLDSCVPHLPNGDETGEVYAIDFGGSTVRAVRCSLQGNGKMAVEQEKVWTAESPFPKGLMDKKAGGTELFNEFAKCAHRLLEKSGDLQKCEAEQKKLPVGFTFSFPCVQTALNSSKLQSWTKGFETGRESGDVVEGQDVAGLLTQALERFKVPLEVKAVVNDTVGTLMSCAYQRKPGSPQCLAALILGTGFNGCYVEPEADKYGYTGSIVNLEAGNYSRELPYTEVDIEVDSKTHNRGHQPFEKFISGYYIGEIVRVAAVRVFKDRAPAKAQVRHSLHGETASLILDDVSESKEKSIKAIHECWGVTMDARDVSVMWEICKFAFDRSAAFAAAVTAALCHRTGKLDDGVTVGIDGALYVKNEWYRERVRYYTDLVLGERAKNIQFAVTDDGSGKGAALIAAVN